jgi:hypothetical protein
MSITPSPSDNTTLTAVLASYATAGFDGSFLVDDDAIRCQSCRAASQPSELRISSLRRLEGASDPADMSAVLALICPSCGQRGTVAVMFGPEASAAEVWKYLGLTDGLVVVIMPRWRIRSRWG